MTPTNLIETAQVRKPRRADLASIRPFAAVTNHIHAHFALGGFNGAVCLPGRNRVALCEKQEVVDQGFHVFLHGSAGWGGDLVVFDADGARRHFVEALMDDAEALAEFFHATEVAVVAVAVYAHRHVKLYLVVGIVWLAFSYVPGYTRTSKHDATETVVEGVGRGDNSDAFGTAYPDAVVSQEFLGFVNTVTKLGGPLVDVIEEAKGEVRVDTAGADVGGVEAGARDTLVEFLTWVISISDQKTFSTVVDVP